MSSLFLIQFCCCRSCCWFHLLLQINKRLIFLKLSFTSLKILFLLHTVLSFPPTFSLLLLSCHVYPCFISHFFLLFHRLYVLLNFIVSKKYFFSLSQMLYLSFFWVAKYFIGLGFGVGFRFQRFYSSSEGDQ